MIFIFKLRETSKHFLMNIIFQVSILGGKLEKNSILLGLSEIFNVHDLFELYKMKIYTFEIFCLLIYIHLLQRSKDTFHDNKKF